MSTKEYLGRIEKLRRMINNKLREVWQLKTLVSSIQAVNTDKVSVQSSGSQDKLGASVAKIVDAEKEAYDAIETYIEERKEIIAKIDGLENAISYDILHRRYVQGMTFEKMADEMSYSVRQVLRIYNDAMHDFERKYGSCH